MSPNDLVIWTDPTTEREQSAVFIGRHGSRLIVETITPSGHLGLRYVESQDVRPTDNGEAK
jgi:hypothetical protein